MESLFEEKKRGKQEKFKNNVSYKLSYLIAIIMYKTNDMGKIDIINRVNEILQMRQSSQNNKAEMVYMIF